MYKECDVLIFLRHKKRAERQTSEGCSSLSEEGATPLAGEMAPANVYKDLTPVSVVGMFCVFVGRTRFFFNGN